MKISLYVFAINLFFCCIAFAQDVTIDADQKLEWHQKENKMVAVGNAVVKKGETTIKADKMTGYYQKDANGKTAVKSVFAEGNVQLISPQADAFGDTLDYDLDKDTVILNGSPAKIKTEKETITSSGGITYYPSKEKAVAVGEVIISDNENKIYSEKLVSYFKKTAAGSLDIDRVEITNNVKITTKDTTVTAIRGEYLPQTGLVKLFDNVVIRQGQNILTGDRAESNLKTGVSRLISNKTSKGRVSGVFKEKEKTDEKN